MRAADVEVALDLREARRSYPTAESLGQLWEALEPGLLHRRLEAGAFFSVSCVEGAIGLVVMRALDGAVTVSDSTVFAIVGLRETATMRYRCRSCVPAKARYGPFICRRCQDAARPGRLCDVHVQILDGALLATCDEHVPVCADEHCSRPATFRCAGLLCGGSTPHCDVHRRSQTGDSTSAYCLRCYDLAFPACETANCHRVATVSCERIDSNGAFCAISACPRHAYRWQVYGPERMGLARCRRHANPHGDSVGEIIRQIVIGTGAPGRRDALPSLRGFQYSLRRAGHDQRQIPLIIVYEEIRALSILMHDSRLDRLVAARTTSWQSELADRGGDDLLDRLRGIIAEQFYGDGAEMASSLTLTDYRSERPRSDGTTRPQLLVVDLPDRYRGLFTGRGGATVRLLAAKLGADLKLERRRR